MALTNSEPLSPPAKVNYRQPTEPSSPEDGEMWLDTDSGVFRVYVDLGSGLDWYHIPPVQVTDEASTFAESDVSVVGGYDINISNGSIELGVTVTDGYSASVAAQTSAGTQTQSCGLAVNPNTQLQGIKAEMRPGVSGADSVFVYEQSSGELLATENFPGGGNTVDIDVTLSEGTNYNVVVGTDDDSSYTRARDDYQQTAYTVTSPDVNLTSGAIGPTGTDSDYAFNISTVTAVLKSGDATSGNALIEWDTGVPADIKAWDLATYQATEDGETVTVDVKSSKGTFPDDFEDGVDSGWSGDTGSLTAQSSTVLNGSQTGELSSSNAAPKVTSPERPTTNNVGFKVQLDSKTGNASDYVQFLIQDSGPSTIGAIEFHDNGDIIWNSTTITTWSTNTEYILELKWDFPNDQVTIDINGTEYGPYGFLQSLSQWVQVAVMNDTTNSGATRSVYFDNNATRISDIGRNFDISTIDTSKNVKLRANLSRNDTANNPTVDYLARRFTR